MSFERQKFLSLIKNNLSICSFKDCAKISDGKNTLDGINGRLDVAEIEDIQIEIISETEK